MTYPYPVDNDVKQDTILSSTLFYLHFAFTLALIFLPWSSGIYRSYRTSDRLFNLLQCNDILSQCDVSPKIFPIFFSEIIYLSWKESIECEKQVCLPGPHIRLFFHFGWGNFFKASENNWFFGVSCQILTLYHKGKPVAVYCACVLSSNL